MMKALLLPMPDGMDRVENGPVQFGDDWPGYYLRGDAAFHLAGVLHAAAGRMGGGDNAMHALALRAIAEEFGKYNVHKDQPGEQS